MSFACDEVGTGHRGRGLLRKHLEQEQLLARHRNRSADDQDTRDRCHGAQRDHISPFRVRQRNFLVDAHALRDSGIEVGVQPAVGITIVDQRLVHNPVDPVGAALAEGLHRVSGQVQHGIGRATVEHQRRKRENPGQA
jgi:hypothetical protein